MGDAIDKYELQVKETVNSSWTTVSASLTGIVGSHHAWSSLIWGQVKYPHQSVDYTGNTGQKDTGEVFNYFDFKIGSIEQ